MSFNLSHLFERVADKVPDREALVTPARRLTYAGLDERANRLANWLAARGVGPGDHVGLHLFNGTEYLEGMLAAFKLRAVPVNVNYRYVERELAYLYDNADLVAVIAHRQFAPVVEAVRTGKIHTLLCVDDATGTPADWPDYEEALAGSDPCRRFEGRSDDDIYLAYTGGTTGMPKGVMWRHEDIFFAALGGGDPLMNKGPITSPDELPERVTDFPLVQLCAPPLMHVSAHWGAFITWFGGGKVVLLSPGSFDPAEAWEAVARERINVITVVGDAMARPLLDELERRGELDTSSLIVFSSGGAILSASTKARISKLLPNVIIIDAFGSSETGVAGTRSDAGEFAVDERTCVFDEELRRVEPGSGVVGRLAKRGHIPLGYYKDEAKTKATFVEVDGVRWVLPGDWARVESDGKVVLLGRDSSSINTGGEKVYAEEVEEVLRGHPDVHDALVVGVPDEVWGERVVAVVAPQPGTSPDLDSLQAEARRHLAGYKVPRGLVTVDAIQRSPSGKPDYGWARQAALEGAGEPA
ncbi:MAG TPA: acyl-CoA synthetase [Acidimicrobiales bacterium]|nr:acyl-CoA synthetase [Acidimicrobiales bacterium]